MFLSILFSILNSFNAQAATLISCHDGDTCRFNDAGHTVNVRFAGIDAPEIKQAGGREARKFLLTLVENKTVELKCEGKSYKRKVCEVHVSGVDVCAEMVRAGWAWDVPKFSHGKYSGLMREARGAKRGIWASGVEGVKMPVCFRGKNKKLCR